MITKNFIRSSIIYTIAGALPMASGFLLVPFYLLYLPASLYGALALYLSFSILVQIIITYSFDASLYLYFHEYKNEPVKLSTYVGSAFTFVLLLSLVISLILFLLGDVIFRSVFDGVAFYPYGMLSVVTSAFQSVFKINNSFLQSRQQPVLFLWSNLLSFFLVAVLTLAGLKFYPGTLIGPVGGKTIAFVVSGAWVLIRIYREFGIHLDLKLLRSTISYNSYQLIYQLQLWVINYFDRPIMAVLIGMVDLGAYDFTVKCLLVIDFMISGLYNSFFPKILSRASGTRLEGTSVEINRYYHGLTAAIMLMVSGTILVLPILINWFPKKPGYEIAVDLVPYAALVFLFRGMRFYFGLPYNTMKVSKPLPVIFLLVAAVRTLLAFWLIRNYGSYGAIAAALSTGGIEVVLLWLWMRERFNYTFNALKVIIGPLLLMAAVLIAEPLLEGRSVLAVHAGYVLFTMVVLLWLYRRELVLLDIRKIIAS